MSRVLDYVQGKGLRKTYYLMVSVLVVLVIIAFPLSANAQTIQVTPTYNNFGTVQLGTSKSAIFTVENTGGFYLEVSAVYITESGSPEFQISQVPTLPAFINPQDGSTIYSIDVEVTFTPSNVEVFSGTLVIASNDQVNPTVTVSLEGTGVDEEPPPPPSIADILAFFDASVGGGILIGDGPGNSADGRRNALRNMIEAAGDLIDDGNFADACEQLMNAYERCDGLTRPPEFVAGPAAQTLAGMILALIGALGCTI